MKARAPTRLIALVDEVVAGGADKVVPPGEPARHHHIALLRLVAEHLPLAREERVVCQPRLARNRHQVPRLVHRRELQASCVLVIEHKSY